MKEPRNSVVEAPPPETTKRSIFVIHLAPVTGKLTPLARKLHIAVTRLAGQQYLRLDATEREEIDSRLRQFVADLRAGTKPDKPPLLLQPRFTASLRELAEAVGYDPSDARHLMDHLKLLEACRVEYNSLRYRGTDEEHELYPDELFVSSSLLSSVVRSGRGLVSWAFDPVVLAIMVMPRTYARLNLDIIRGVRSYAALALYENCQRFVNIGKTGVFTTAQWRRLLSPTGQVPEWRDNERELTRTIKAALVDLRACDACDIELEPVRVRMPDNKLGLQFKVKLLDQHRLPFGEPVPADKELHAELLALGFKPAEARRLLEARDESYLRSKMALLRKAKNVQNPRGWLISALEKDFQDEEAQREADAREREEKLRQLRNVEEVKEAFKAWQNKRLRELFSELLEDERTRWEVRFSESTTAATMLSGKARQSAFFGWLLQQEGLQLLREPADVDAITFATLRPDKAEQKKLAAKDAVIEESSSDT